MKNLVIPPHAEQLIEEAGSLDEDKILAVESDGMIAVNFTGIVACRSIEMNSDPVVALIRAEDTFGRVQISEKPSGNFLQEHLVPALERQSRKEQGECLKWDKMRAVSVGISNGQAAWLFLDGDLSRDAVIKPEEAIKVTYSSFFSHGCSNQSVNREKIGWKFVVDLGLNDVELGHRPTTDLNVLPTQRDSDIPKVEVSWLP